MGPREHRTVLTGAGALAVGLALASCTAAQTVGKPTSRPTPSSSTAETPTAGPTPEASALTAEADAHAVYTDGTYEARGWYGGLPSHHDVTLTIEDDLVTSVEITTPAENETSLGYQQRFAEALPAAVIGFPVDQLDIDRLAGSSGCSEGFMNALAEIKTEARAEG